jgi:hypothetical protein
VLVVVAAGNLAGFPGYVGVVAAGRAGGDDVIGVARPGWRRWVAGDVHPGGSRPAFWL